jgi:hypothetical protein
VTTSGIGDLGESDFELASVDEVSAGDAARRARERVELINLLSLAAGAAPNLCCNNLYVESGISQACACDSQGPGAEECLGDCSGQCAHAETDSLDGGIGVSDGLLDGRDDRLQQPEFMHPPMMPEPAPLVERLESAPALVELVETGKP